MRTGNGPSISRRTLLRQSFLGALLVSGFDQLRWPALLLQQSFDTRRDGKLLGVVPFSDEGHPPMEQPLGSELDGRLLTDLSAVSSQAPLTLTEHFFIRTRASKLLDTSRPWTIQVGAGHKPLIISTEDLTKKVRSMGAHVMECAGNTRAAHFGMLSVAEWDGVPLSEVLETALPQSRSAGMLISGFDFYKEESMTSTPGAAWIFSPDQLFSANAFLATKMNGKPLNPDHGAPVRLVVPGWYGCVCIKWVNQLDFVSNDARATSQMEEYAGRTMQSGVPSLARDYQPATIDPAAMPTHIEKWLIGEKIRYRVRGIQWGGRFVPRQPLEIRFNPTEEFVPVENVRLSPGDSLTFWNHEWNPPRPGRFTIRLRLNSANTRTRRLDSGYYDRSVDIEEI